MQTMPSTFSADEFEAFAAREHDRLELKTGAGRKPIQEALVAFSNAEGGVILIGVSDTRQVVGCVRNQGIDDAIHSAAADAHNVGKYVIRQLSVGGRPVVAVLVEPRHDEVAASSDGRILVRRGAHNRFAVGAELRALVNTRSLVRYESTDTGVPLTSADDDFVARLSEAYGWKVERRTQALRERGLVTDSETLTVAGAL